MTQAPPSEPGPTWDSGAAAPPPQSPACPPGQLTSDDRTMAALCHGLGIINPIITLIIWLVKRDQSAFVNEQGKEAVNWQITVVIASIPVFLTMLIFIGFLLAPVLGIANIVFCIQGALAANKGQAYRYPISLRLIK